jgi:hypothetical protein
MRNDLEPALERWVSVKLIDLDTAQKIRAYETEHRGRAGERWQILVVVALGSIMLAGGVLLFIAAHWESLSPTQRFLLVLSKIAALHVAGALTSRRFPALSVALHGIGTVALGAGIFLAGQIFNLQEHWPGGVMLWALGAALGWWVLRDWVQGTLLALLLPAWLTSEWIDATERYANADRITAAFVLLVMITYLSAVRGGVKESPLRRALLWVGGIGILPAAIATCGMASEVVSRGQWGWYRYHHWLSTGDTILAWGVAIMLPLALAWRLRRQAAWMNAVAAVWVLLLAYSHAIFHADTAMAFIWNKVSVYLLGGIGAIGLVLWGMIEERKERINLGLAGFAVTVMFFYFSEVMDKLGRSAALIGLGLLFLVVAWAMERTRRSLMKRMTERAQ